MKIKLAKRNAGLTWFMALILILLVVAFVATLAYVLIRAIERIFKPRPNNDEAAYRQKLVEDELAALRAAHPNEVVTFSSASFTEIWKPAFVPFDPENAQVTVFRSTNLLDWEFMQTLNAGETFMDTNPPPDRAFYRSQYQNGESVPVGTNGAARFELLRARGNNPQQP